MDGGKGREGWREKFREVARETERERGREREGRTDGEGGTDSMRERAREGGRERMRGREGGREREQGRDRESGLCDAGLQLSAQSRHCDRYATLAADASFIITSPSPLPLVEEQEDERDCVKSCCV